MIKIEIKPLSVNKAWQGKRFKTDEYKVYERSLLFMLPKLKLPEPPFLIEFEFGFSNASSDWDNPIKPLQDVLQKKYGFNDKDVFKAIVSKEKVSKGKDYLKFKISSL
ncbi:hypothetical protein QO206_13185 [Leeuwenhoekiella aequorea]|mgnify:CR=1 FL=1|uniref:hypothetical protein n=1 Tax=Leeuwenhoekiella aequorea TaxID=283736 RepID=UPI00352E2EF5|tara:strand:+ start:6769 stop:7092 length:324 start_codon:yes stop_codon:yes gene_type:complete